MDNRVLSASLLFIFIIQAVRSADVPTNITIFYETHCPDSQKLMISQVIPTLDRFDSDVHIELVPYGFASYDLVNGTLSCQHGHIECEGNTIHACAQKYYGTRHEQVIRFAGCTMQHDVKVLDFVKECAERYDFVYSDLKHCASSEEGLKLLQAMAHRTEVGARIYSPTKKKFAFIPSTFIDGKPYIEEAVADLPGTICRVASTKPKKC